MKIKSFSKINLTLRVLNRFKNGMHNIETNSTLVDLSDEINIKRNKKNIVTFSGKFKNQVNKKKNTVKDTLILLEKNNITKNFYKIRVKKISPFMLA